MYEKKQQKNKQNEDYQNEFFFPLRTLFFFEVPYTRMDVHTFSMQCYFRVKIKTWI